MVHAEAAAIKPDQEGCLRPHGLDARKVFFTETDDEIDVVLQIGDHLPPPLFAVLEGGKSDNRGEHRRLAEFIHLQPIEELMAYLLIRDNGIRADDARDVERLRGGGQCDAVAGGGFRDGCERDVPVVPHAMSQWISSDTTRMWCSMQKSASQASVSRSHTTPPGLCGLHRISILHLSSTTDARCSKSM